MLRIVDKAERVPGRCAVSGSSDGPFFDSGVDVRGYGRVYVSTAAVRAMAGDLGMADAESIVTLTAKVEEQAGQIEELEGFKASVAKVFQALDRKPPRARRTTKPAGE